MIPLIVAVFALVLPAIYVVLVHNSLIALGNHIRDSWSDVDTELKRRYDLIPNLVSTVKGYAAHERQVLERVTQLRSQCIASTGAPSRQAADENELVGALSRMLALVETYPKLKADGQFAKLQKELVNTEDRIQAARRFYNGNIRDYRDKRESFPSNLVAAGFGFGPVEFFTVHPSVREVPDVDL